ncbi:hypothetical protein AURDEDRAFT_187635 [Auricularia subglabra TFB-10046 SS5]|nr:hypothetical protein AURDEDRAFT_187635 [Auricularia subglabra TFB-10046 SS5]
MADPPDPSLAALFGSLQRGQIVHYLHVASACLFVYDHFTTFADEVSLIWQAPWSTGKALFLVSRYITWPELVFAIYRSIVAGITVAETVLILRTWALWGGRRIVLFGLAFLLFAITAVNGWIVFEYTRHTRLAEVPGIGGCVVTSTTHIIALAWILVSAFELVILLMTVAKGIQHFKESSSTLIGSLYRDGILYYLSLFAVSLANMVFVISAQAEYIILLAELQRSFHAIFCCRIILHLRAVRAASSVPSIGTETVFGWFGALERGSSR